ncbi:uncharacterized protein LOC135959109 [Calliphora vicina]|uniref:uncharacterized protein LOC135959109 n=1 Tax=Calliphora vicina TaxID=7373 RepID=UPI00325C0489
MKTFPVKSSYSQLNFLMEVAAATNRCGDFLNPPIDKTPWRYRKSKRFKHLKNKQFKLCEQLQHDMCVAASKSCCYIEDQATDWYKRQKEMMRGPIKALSEINLHLKPAIRDLKPKEGKELNAFISYISPEFQELLRLHDERMREKCILNYLPRDYTRRRLRPAKENLETPDIEEIVTEKQMHVICSCSKLVQDQVDVKKRAKKCRSLCAWSCCSKHQESLEEFEECRCADEREKKPSSLKIPAQKPRKPFPVEVQKPKNLFARKPAAKQEKLPAEELLKPKKLFEPKIKEKHPKLLAKDVENPKEKPLESPKERANEALKRPAEKPPEKSFKEELKKPKEPAEKPAQKPLKEEVKRPPPKEGNVFENVWKRTKEKHSLEAAENPIKLMNLKPRYRQRYKTTTDKIKPPKLAKEIEPTEATTTSQQMNQETETKSLKQNKSRNSDYTPRVRIFKPTTVQQFPSAKPMHTTKIKPFLTTKRSAKRIQAGASDAQLPPRIQELNDLSSKSSLQEIWTKLNATEMRESNVDIKDYRPRIHIPLEDPNADAYSLPEEARQSGQPKKWFSFMSPKADYVLGQENSGKSSIKTKYIETIQPPKEPNSAIITRKPSIENSLKARETIRKSLTNDNKTPLTQQYSRNPKETCSCQQPDNQAIPPNSNSNYYAQNKTRSSIDSRNRRPSLEACAFAAYCQDYRPYQGRRFSKDYGRNSLDLDYEGNKQQPTKSHDDEHQRQRSKQQDVQGSRYGNRYSNMHWDSCPCKATKSYDDERTGQSRSDYHKDDRNITQEHCPCRDAKSYDNESRQAYRSGYLNDYRNDQQQSCPCKATKSYDDERKRQSRFNYYKYDNNMKPNPYDDDRRRKANSGRQEPCPCKQSKSNDDEAKLKSHYGYRNKQQDVEDLCPCKGSKSYDERTAQSRSNSYRNRQHCPCKPSKSNDDVDVERMRESYDERKIQSRCDCGTDVRNKQQEACPCKGSKSYDDESQTEPRSGRQKPCPCKASKSSDYERYKEDCSRKRSKRSELQSEQDSCSCKLSKSSDDRKGKSRRFSKEDINEQREEQKSCIGNRKSKSSDSERKQKSLSGNCQQQDVKETCPCQKSPSNNDKRKEQTRCGQEESCSVKKSNTKDTKKKRKQQGLQETGTCQKSPICDEEETCSCNKSEDDERNSETENMKQDSCSCKATKSNRKKQKSVQDQQDVQEACSCQKKRQFSKGKQKSPTKNCQANSNADSSNGCACQNSDTETCSKDTNENKNSCTCNSSKSCEKDKSKSSKQSCKKASANACDRKPKSSSIQNPTKAQPDTCTCQKTNNQPSTRYTTKSYAYDALQTARVSRNKRQSLESEKTIYLFSRIQRSQRTIESEKLTKPTQNKANDPSDFKMSSKWADYRYKYNTQQVSGSKPQWLDSESSSKATKSRRESPRSNRTESLPWARDNDSRSKASTSKAQSCRCSTSNNQDDDNSRSSIESRGSCESCVKDTRQHNSKCSCNTSNCKKSITTDRDSKARQGKVSGNRAQAGHCSNSNNQDNDYRRSAKDSRNKRTPIESRGSCEPRGTKSRRGGRAQTCSSSKSYDNDTPRSSIDSQVSRLSHRPSRSSSSKSSRDSQCNCNPYDSPSSSRCNSQDDIPAKKLYRSKGGSSTNFDSNETPKPTKAKTKPRKLSMCCISPERGSSDSDTSLKHDENSNEAKEAQTITSKPKKIQKLSFKDSLCCMSQRKVAKSNKDKATQEEIVAIEETPNEEIVLKKHKCKLPARPPTAAKYTVPLNLSKHHEMCYKDSHYWSGVTANYPKNYQDAARRQQIERNRLAIQRKKLWGKTCPKAKPSKEFYQDKHTKRVGENCVSDSSLHVESDGGKESRDENHQLSKKEEHEEELNKGVSDESPDPNKSSSKRVQDASAAHRKCDCESPSYAESVRGRERKKEATDDAKKKREPDPSPSHSASDTGKASRNKYNKNYHEEHPNMKRVRDTCPVHKKCNCESSSHAENRRGKHKREDKEVENNKKLRHPSPVHSNCGCESSLHVEATEARDASKSRKKFSKKLDKADDIKKKKN